MKGPSSVIMRTARKSGLDIAELLTKVADQPDIRPCRPPFLPGPGTYGWSVITDRFPECHGIVRDSALNTRGLPKLCTIWMVLENLLEP